MPTLFFMPWTKVKAALRIGPVSFVLYNRGFAPGPLGKTGQATLDAIVGNYADRAFLQDDASTVPVQEAIILRWPEDDVREDLLSDDELQERLQQAQLLVFAAISARRYGGHWDYCNADDLLVTAQHSSHGNPASTAIQSRRRDGISTSIMAGTTGKPVFLRPMHVSKNYSLDMDWEFALALLNMPPGKIRDRVMIAATMFIRANTDAPEVPASAEIVFMRAAVETLVDADHTTQQLKQKLGALMTSHLGPIEWRDKHIPPAAWQVRWTDPKGQQPDRPFTAWIKDFCHWRNEGAHGKGGGKIRAPAVWSLANHLMFTSWFTSHIVKCLLAAEGMYRLTEEDKDELLNAELFFTYDISTQDGNRHLYRHEVLNHVECLKLANFLR